MSKTWGQFGVGTLFRPESRVWIKIRSKSGLLSVWFWKTSTRPFSLNKFVQNKEINHETLDSSLVSAGSSGLDSGCDSSLDSGCDSVTDSGCDSGPVSGSGSGLDSSCESSPVSGLGPDSGGPQMKWFFILQVRETRPHDPESSATATAPHLKHKAVILLLQILLLLLLSNKQRMQRAVARSSIYSLKQERIPAHIRMVTLVWDHDS